MPSSVSDVIKTKGIISSFFSPTPYLEKLYEDVLRL